MNHENIPFSKIQFSPELFPILPFGIGTWAWGDRFYWSFGEKTLGEEDLTNPYNFSVDAGITLFDTAEAYGMGRSEKILGRLVKRSNKQVLIASKFFPYPWRTSACFRRALRGSLKRLGVPAIDLYQMHWPLPLVSISSWMERMADAFEDGLIKAVGVSNYNMEQTEQAAEALEKRGLKLASNQILYNLIERGNEFNGLLDFCQNMGIHVIAYSPLAQGILTGKYNPQNPPPGVRGIMNRKGDLIRFQRLLDAVETIAGARQRTPAQVALNWTLCKGTIPIPGVKSLSQVKSNIGALDWKLTPEEVRTLDEASASTR